MDVVFCSGLKESGSRLHSSIHDTLLRHAAHESGAGLHASSYCIIMVRGGGEDAMQHTSTPSYSARLPGVDLDVKDRASVAVVIAELMLAAASPAGT